MQEQGSAPQLPTNVGRIASEALGSENLVPVLIEFHEPPVVVWRSQHPLATAAQVQAYEESLRRAHRHFLKGLSGDGVACRVSSGRALQACGDEHQEIVVDHDFTYLFNGLGLLMPGNRVLDLAQRPGVKAVTGNHERPYLSSDSIPFIGAPAVWQRKDPEGNPCDGKGVTIAIIDTGLDWTHPAFGGFPKVPNEKVIYAVSYTGEPQKDNFGHGSHCAGIAAGDLYKGTSRGDSKIQGVAPKAQLMSYKVLTAMGSGTAAAIIMAIEDAVLRGAHVLSLSLGDTVGDPNSPEAVAVNNAMLAGAVVCCAAGNSGPAPGTVGSPGSADLVLTVGASTDDSVTATYTRAVGTEKRRDVETRLLHGSAPMRNPALPLHYVDCGLGRSDSDFPDTVFGRIALIRRGSVSFRQKAKAAQAAGALAALIVNNTAGNFWGTLGDPTPDDPQPSIPVVSVAQSDGEYLLRLGFDQDGVSLLPLLLDPTAVPIPDHLAEFSSRGPSQNLMIKPELCAPGVNIYSATILEGPLPNVPNMADPSGYTVASGTSMATPHIAGCAALLRQLHPDWTPFWIKAALVNTARWMHGQGSAAEQGNGRVDVLAAARASAILVCDSNPVQPTLSFGSIDHGGQVTSLVRPLRLIDLAGGGGRYNLRVHMRHRTRGLSVALSHRQVTLGRGCAADLELTVTIDGRTLKDGAYDGFVVATGSDGETLRLPFYLATQNAGELRTGSAHATGTVSTT